MLGVVLAFTGLYAFSQWLMFKEREKWAGERAELISRIQTPEVAKVLDMPEPTDEPTYLPFDDDEAWREYRDDRFAGRVK